MQKIHFLLFSFAFTIQMFFLPAHEVDTTYLYQSVNVITGEYCENQKDLHLGGKHPLSLWRSYVSGDSMTQGWSFNHPNIPAPVCDFPGDGKTGYCFDGQGRLKRITTGNGEEIFHTLNLSYQENANGETICSAESEEGSVVQYTFAKTDDAGRALHPFLLQQVNASNGSQAIYRYRDHPRERKKIVCKKEEPEGRYLINEYYDSFLNDVGGTIVKIKDLNHDPRIGKVKLQKEPAGVDGTPVATSRFFYYRDHTVVYDALNHKTVYRFGENGKLSSIDAFLTEHVLYRSEKFYWDANDRLLSRVLETGSGEIPICETFEYDSAGNLTKKTLYGNLTGRAGSGIILGVNGLPIENGCERYATSYQYSDHCLLCQTEDNGVTIRYAYDQEQMTGKFTYDRKLLRLRQFFQYDREGDLIASIVDDGVTENAFDLTGVTERRIVRFHPKMDHPGKRLPQVVERKYLDISTGKEELVQHIILEYSPKGEVISQKIFNAAGNPQQTFLFSYDSNGRLVELSDSKGNVNRTVYDANGNPVIVCERDRTVLQSYDYNNRLIRKEQVNDGIPNGVVHYRYDPAGGLIASCDRFGNETAYVYDSFGRPTQTVYPLVAVADKNTVHPTIRKTYDVMDRVVSLTDPNGHTVKTAYNARGRPTEIIYQDGSSEKYEYNLDGTLRKRVFKNGSCQLYKRDFQSRVESEEFYTPQGELASSRMRKYSSFHLICDSEPSGKLTLFKYDGAGRQIEVEEHTARGVQVTAFAYDAMGRVMRKTCHHPKHSTSIVEEIERDDNHLITALNILDEKGNILKRSTLTKEDDAWVDFFHKECCNSYGQIVLQTHSVDRCGATTIITYDALGRPIEIQKNNPLGQTIQSKAIVYDAAGNKIEETHQIYGAEHAQYPYVCRWEWGPENRLTALLEGYGSGKVRKTEYFYAKDGSLETIVKPDRSSLSYRFSPTGKPVCMKSSDGSIHYTYVYDSLDRLTEVKDHIHETSTARKYTQEGLVAHEKLGNGLSFEKAYDCCRRKTEIILPDHSQVRYAYDAAYLRRIERLDQQGNVRYTHQYNEYSLQGLLLEATLIGKTGTLQRSYDENNRLTGIDFQHWKQRIDRDSTRQITHVATEDPSGSYLSHYTYDEMQQLVRESSFVSHDFSYDSMYRPTKVDATEVQCDELGQLIAHGENRYSYDLNGNLLSCCTPCATSSLEYDALNRLIQVNKGDFRLRYHYDCFNRLLKAEKERWNGADTCWQKDKTKLYLYDGKSEIGAADESGTIEELRVLGSGLGADVGAAVAIEIHNKPYAPIHDYRGSVCALIDSHSGNPKEWSRYSAFGEETTFQEAACTGNQWKFSSKRIVPEAGLLFFGCRHYSPELRRWITKDPLGSPDSINRYAFNLNNPINRIDLAGLFSFSNAFRTIRSSLQQCYEVAECMINVLRHHLSFSEYIRPTLDEMGQIVFGKTFLQFSGFYKTDSKTGIHGRGEISDKVRITLVNGILNCREDFKRSLTLLSEAHGGANVHYIFDATEGWCRDILRCLFVKFGYVSPQAHLIAEVWREMIGEMGGIHGGGVIYHYAHSLGGAHTKAALRLMSPEEKALICIYTFGSPTVIADECLNHVCNYVSVRDGVCLLDPIGFFGGLFFSSDDVITVGDWLGVPFIDHLMHDSTYTNVIQMLGREVVNEHVFDTFACSHFIR